MKKLILTNILPILLIMTFVLSGCDVEGVMCAHLCDKTQGLSTNYAFNMVLDKDSRVEGKYVDLQIKCSDAGQIISFGKELEEKTSLYFEKADEWYNLTVLIANANGLSGYETYEKYEEKGNQIYLLNSSSDTKLSFRVVVGNVTENDAGTGQILTSTEIVSNIFELNVKKSEN